MAKRVGQKIKMTSIDELLCVPSVAGCDEIEVAKIRPFKDHPFKNHRSCCIQMEIQSEGKSNNY